jgi:hypothetical protein
VEPRVGPVRSAGATMLLLAGVGAYFGMWACSTSGYGRKMGMIQGYWGNEWWIQGANGGVEACLRACTRS